jgi:hypothetical protein
MIPVNDAAIIIHAALAPLLARCEVQRIEWSGDTALIFAYCNEFMWSEI